MLCILIGYSGHVGLATCFCHVVSSQYTELNEVSCVYIGIKSLFILPKHHMEKRKCISRETQKHSNNTFLIYELFR